MWATDGSTMLFTVFILFSIFADCTLTGSINYEDLVVELRQGGSVIGTQTTVPVSPNNVKVGIFLGIPFGQPPLGELRFVPPKPFSPWNGTRDAKQFAPSCMQFPRFSYKKLNVSEDCLYLNIWSPWGEGKPKTNLAVMVWIHGGAFIFGSSQLDTYDGLYLAARHDVIVVSIQYRLGTFGFLRLGNFGKNNVPNTKEDAALGNQGILDQILALQWVQKNIVSFGGDPNSVTVFGESAGSATTSILVVSPLARNLFKRAIMESGTLLSVWGLESIPESEMKGKIVAKSCLCEKAGSTREEVIQCLQKASHTCLLASELFILGQLGIDRYNILLDKYPNVKNYPYVSPTHLPGLTTRTEPIDVPIKPVIDGNIIPNKFNSRAESNFISPTVNTREIMTGVNKEEGLVFIMYFLGMNETNFIKHYPKISIPEGIIKAAKRESLQPGGEKADFFWTVLAQILSKENMRPDVAFLPPQFYGLPMATKSPKRYMDPDNTEITPLQLLERLSQLVGDLYFACPALDFANSITQLPDSKVYFYHFKYRTKLSEYPDWAHSLHGDEMEYVFQLPRNPIYALKYTQKEIELSDRMSTMWTNFAKTGDPNSDSMSTKWPQFLPSRISSGSGGEHLVIDLEMSTGERFKQDQCRFWLHTMKMAKQNV